MPKTLRHVDLKIVLLGCTGVGKSTLAYQYVNGAFSDSIEGTIGACFMVTRMVDETRGLCVKCSIWDTGGQERYDSIAPLYYRNCDAAIIVYDASRKRETIGKAHFWIEKIRRECKDTIKYIALVANKMDLCIDMSANKMDLCAEKMDDKESLLVSYDSADTHMRTSAKTGEGVAELFDKVIEYSTQDLDQLETQKMIVRDNTVPVVYEETSLCC